MKREEADKLLHEKVEAGELVSPVLPGGVKNYLIDIDGTITEDVPNELLYPDCCCGTDIVVEDSCLNPLDKEFSLPGYFFVISFKMFRLKSFTMSEAIFLRSCDTPMKLEINCVD